MAITKPVPRRWRRATWSLIIVPVALLAIGHATTPKATPAPIGTPAIDVQVDLSTLARHTLEKNGEGIMLSATWYGWPAAHAQYYANEIGTIDLGQALAELPITAPIAHLSPPNWRAARVGHIEGDIYGNVNAYSTRRQQPDNILACDFADGSQIALGSHLLTLRCALISEHEPTRHIER